jgi:hypothetical protein
MRSVQGEKPGTGRSDEVTDPAADQAKRTFDDINPANAPSGYRFTDTLTMEGEVKVIRTEVTAPDGSTGWIERAFDPTTGKFEMRNAFLDEIPKDLRVLTLEGGQTMPLVDYLTLRQMQLIDAPFGGIVTVKMSTIQNARTVAHVAGQAKKGVPPETSIRGTHSVTYAERSIAGSGHRVRSAKIVEGTGRTDPFDVMLEWYETRGNPGGPRDAKMQAAHDKILTQEGVSRTDPVLWDFDIVIELEPVAQPGGGGAGAGAGTPAGSSPTTVVGPPSPSEESDREPVPVP